MKEGKEQVEREKGKVRGKSEIKFAHLLVGYPTTGSRFFPF
jgi:hypothetical protein